MPGCQTRVFLQAEHEESLLECNYHIADCVAKIGPCILEIYIVMQKMHFAIFFLDTISTNSESVFSQYHIVIPLSQ